MNSNSNLLPYAKDLTQQPPRSAAERLGGFVILARSIDKGRARVNATNGEYRFNCPVDQLLFNFKGVVGTDVQELLASGANDEDVVEWFNTHGVDKTPDEIKAWSAQMDEFSFYFVPEKKAWFISECERLQLDPVNTTLFEYLDVDDRKTFGLPVPIQDRHP